MHTVSSFCDSVFNFISYKFNGDLKQHIINLAVPVSIAVRNIVNESTSALKPPLSHS